MYIRQIRNYLRYNVGNRIIVITHGSRNKKEKYVGILNCVYNNIFTIKLCNGSIISFKYNDILTKSIQICI